MEAHFRNQRIEEDLYTHFGANRNTPEYHTGQCDITCCQFDRRLNHAHRVSIAQNTPQYALRHNLKLSFVNTPPGQLCLAAARPNPAPPRSRSRDPGQGGRPPTARRPGGSGGGSAAEARARTHATLTTLYPLPK